MQHSMRIAGAVALLAAGCTSSSVPKPTLERGWIGGEYQKAKRTYLPKDQKSAVYVKQVYSGTPAERAGLQPADLIGAVNGRPVRNLKEFRKAIDGAPPGSRGVIRAMRRGRAIDLPVVFGRETYQQWHALTMGLGLSTKLDLWPDPNFELLSLGRYKRSDERVELRSPEKLLAEQAGGEVTEGERGARSDEGWSLWLLVFGFDAHKRILAQEAVATAVQ